jgi:2-polyprenyl-3-methyl-5-hydroxy-6-metoxy-1,4-benzoquinol methylase
VWGGICTQPTNQQALNETPISLLGGVGELKLKNSVTQVFGKERAALYEAEIQHLAENGYSRAEMVDFLERYAAPTGAFYALSMINRSKLGIKELTEALDFLFNPTSTIVKALRGVLPPRCKVMDFGCGRGQLTCALALQGFQTYGVDISQDALKIAGKLASKLNCTAAFHLVRNNKLPFPSEYFDAVLSFWVFHEIGKDRLSRVVKELHRTVRKDGFVLVVDQEGVAKFDTIKDIMKQHGFKLHSEKAISPVYDHGKASRALMVTFMRKA